MESKVCPRCKERKPISAFNKRNRKGKTAGAGYCRVCSAVYSKEHRRTPEQEHDSKMRSSFGISAAEYAALFDAQRGLCLICGLPEREKRNGKVKRLAVDHCHDTGVIRGLLCAKCNTGLGKFNDDPALLAAAIEYLEQKRLI